MNVKPKVKKIRELLPGEFFIWADNRTRNYMCSDEEPHRNQVLYFVDADEEELTFVYLDGDTGSLFYDEGCRVIVVDRMAFIYSAIRCEVCGDIYTRHDFLKNPQTTYRDPQRGITCPSVEDGHFVPLESDLMKFHPEQMGVDFFAELGL